MMSEVDIAIALSLLYLDFNVPKLCLTGQRVGDLVIELGRTGSYRLLVRGASVIYYVFTQKAARDSYMDLFRTLPASSI